MALCNRAIFEMIIPKTERLWHKLLFTTNEHAAIIDRVGRKCEWKWSCSIYYLQICWKSDWTIKKWSHCIALIERFTEIARTLCWSCGSSVINRMWLHTSPLNMVWISFHFICLKAKIPKLHRYLYNILHSDCLLQHCCTHRFPVELN